MIITWFELTPIIAAKRVCIVVLLRALMDLSCVAGPQLDDE